MKKFISAFLICAMILGIGILTGCEKVEPYQFKSGELENYVIVYANDNPDFFEFANALSDRIYEKYGVMLSVMPDIIATPAEYEIVLGDTIHDNRHSKVMEYSVTVHDGKFKINVGGSFSAEKAVEFLCKNVFNGKELILDNGEYYKEHLMTKRYDVTDGTSARIMTANILADSFADSSYQKAYYRAEIFAGMLVSSTPDIVGLQEVDQNWNEVLDSYLTRIQNAYGITYSRCLATHQDKINYTSMLYRSDKFTPEGSGVNVFEWWEDSKFNHDYHMRNVSWAQFSSLEDTDENFIVANTHWSYRTEHANGSTYLAGSDKPIAENELREQCKNQTDVFLSELRQSHPETPIFMTGDFNTSLAVFTQSNWIPTDFRMISEEAKRSGKAEADVPETGHFDHLFGTGKYTINKFAYIKDINHIGLLTDHPFVYADFAF